MDREPYELESPDDDDAAEKLQDVEDLDLGEVDYLATPFDRQAGAPPHDQHKHDWDIITKPYRLR